MSKLLDRISFEGQEYVLREHYRSLAVETEKLCQENAELVETLKYIAKFGCCACEVEAENALTKHGQGAVEK